MTKPNFVSSHDWHIQLCCQRSWLHPPERAVSDQGLNRPKPDWCPRTWCAVFRLSVAASPHLTSLSGPNSAVFVGHCAACDVLRELFKVIEVPASCQPRVVDFFGSVYLSPEIFHRKPNQPAFAQRKLSKYRNGRQSAAEHSAPETSNCSGLGLESGRPWAM